MNPSPERLALEAVRVGFAVVLCLIVPFAALYAAFALNSGDGLAVGAVPLAGALLLLGTARWPEGIRVGVTIGAFLATIVYSLAVISWVIKSVAH